MPAFVTRIILPEPSLKQFVDSAWMLHNESGEAKEVVIVPDGRIDLSLSVSREDPFHILLMGLGTGADQTTVAPGTRMFAVSFNPIVVEYLFSTSAAGLVNQVKQLPEDFWDFSEKDLDDFEAFARKAFQKIAELLAGKETDPRKIGLFERIYASRGSASVKELSAQVHWSSRQINRYFSQQYGLSLKAYCNIIRFRASLHHLKQGRLFPGEHFADQSHFIKQIKKLSGVSPKKLAKNQNDRFVQFSALPPR